MNGTRRKSAQERETYGWQTGLIGLILILFGGATWVGGVGVLLAVIGAIMWGAGMARSDT